MDTTQRRRLQSEFGVARHRIVLLGDLDPQVIDARTVEDPEGKEPDTFDRVYGRIARCINALALALPVDSVSEGDEIGAR